MNLELSSSLHREKKLIRSFGRIKSRKFSDHKNFLLENLMPKYELDSFKSCHHKVEAGQFKKVVLEIGSGFGDFIFNKSSANRDKLFIGCEPHLNGLVNILSMLKNSPLDNICLYRQDVRFLIESMADDFLNHIFILFPDPWPKSKHRKRRLINKEFLDLIAKKVKKDGKLTIATDHDDYKTAIMASINQTNSWCWLAKSSKDWQEFPADWVETKYQKKAKIESRNSIIFELVKASK